MRLLKRIVSKSHFVNQNVSFVFALSLQDILGMQCFTVGIRKGTDFYGRYVKGVPLW